MCKYGFIIFNELLWFFFFLFGVILELFVQFSKFKFLIVLDDDDERFVVGDSLILKRSWSGDDSFVCYLFI